MANKLTHKVVISQGGVKATFRLSDKEMESLCASSWTRSNGKHMGIAIIFQCMLSLNMKPHVQNIIGLQDCLTIIRGISFGMIRIGLKNEKMFNC